MSVRTSYILILAITLWRILWLAFDRTDLFVDETQYWLWSQNPDFGYYSKPPAIAWVLSAITGIAESSDIFWIRVGGPVIHAATAAVLVAAARGFVGRDVAGWVGVAFVTAPAVALSSILFSTDVLLLLFIAITLWAYFGLTQRRSWPLALVMGAGFGCAFLSKYAVLFLLPGGLLALLLVQAARIGWRDFFIAGLTALVVALPNLWWNLAHDITTVRHTQDIAHWDGLGLDIGGGIGFFLAQFGVVGPVLFSAMLWGVWRMAKGDAETRDKMLIWLSMPVVALITLQALLAKAYANWAVSAYAAGVILAVWILHRFWRRGLFVSLAINGLVSAILPLAPVFATSVTMPDGRLALERYLGRSDLSRKIGGLALKSGTSVIVSDNRDILADLFYTLRDEPFRIYAKPPEGFPKSYYEQAFALPPDETGMVLFITRTMFACGTEATAVEEWRPVSGYYRAKAIHAYVAPAACMHPRPESTDVSR